MAATCTPLDPGEASQVSGPVIPHARASSLILPKSIVGDVSLRLKVLAFRSFQISQFTNRRRDLRALVGMSVGFPSRIHHSSTECVGLQ